MELVSVLARSENGVIDRDGELPWPSVPADKRQYRAQIANDPMILGRVTFESMLDDLPGSAQIVMSRSMNDNDVSLEHAHVVSFVEEAIETAATLRDTTYVSGGGIIDELFQPHVDRMVLSRIRGTTRETRPTRRGTTPSGRWSQRRQTTGLRSKSGLETANRGHRLCHRSYRVFRGHQYLHV